MTGAAGGSQGTLAMLIPLVLMFVLFYFLLIRPQRKREKTEKQMRDSIVVGDNITTIGGIVGKIVSIKDESLILETGADRVKIRIERWAIRSKETISSDT